MRQPGPRVVHTASADEMRAFGARLAQALRSAPSEQSFIVTLSGELGAGKTTLVGGLLSALGCPGPVRSPTYTLIEPYQLAGREVLHCDLYRLRHPDEIDDLGLRDLAGPGSVLLVEWPERAGGRLGEPDVALRLTYEDAGRACEVDARTAAGQALTNQLLGPI